LGIGAKRALNFILALTAGVCGASPAAAQDARQILIRSVDASAAYVGEQVTEAGMRPNGARRVQRQQVLRSGEALRINYPNGRVLYDDGKEQLLYLPRQGVVEKSPSRRSPQRLRQQRRALQARALVVEQLADGQVAGHPAYVVSVKTPKGAARKVWVHRENYVQLRQDQTLPNGRAVSTYFTRISFEAPKESLAFVPPPGARVVQHSQRRPLPLERAVQRARAWGGLLQPKTIPPGFVFEGHYPHSFNGRPGLVSVYASPRGQILSFFQGPSLGMNRTMQRQEDRLQVLSARKGAAEVTLVGPLSEDQMVQVMDSVAAAPP
jgi:hypothetical protein